MDRLTVQPEEMSSVQDMSRSSPVPGSDTCSKSFLDQAGFTLLEIVIVVTILGLVVGLAIPRLPDLTGVQIQKAARGVAMTLQLARTRAVSLRRFYRIDVNIEDNTVSVTYYGPEGTYIQDDTLKSYETGDTGITDVVTLTKGKVVEGTGRIHISPRGFTEPALIHLRDVRGRDLTVLSSLISGRIRILEGYADLDSR
jgi:prepilin-type N-terminal cleavage/methylation domain-containing protein